MKQSDATQVINCAFSSIEKSLCFVFFISVKCKQQDNLIFFFFKSFYWHSEPYNFVEMLNGFNSSDLQVKFICTCNTDFLILLLALRENRMTTFVSCSIIFAMSTKLLTSCDSKARTKLMKSFGISKIVY